MEISICDLLQLVLYLYWSLSSAVVLIALCKIPGTEKLRNAVLLSAARGKTWTGHDESLKWIPNWTVPQSYFWHFYVIGIFAVLVLFSLLRHNDQDNGLVLLLLFFAHVLRRFVESVLLMHYPLHAKMHLIAYVFGVSYYIMVPLSLSNKALCRYDFVPNNRQQFLYNVSLAVDRLGQLRSLAFGGIVVFLFGSGIQFHSHYLLSKLRSRLLTKSKKDVYVIPMGGMFGLVSCPHYFGEIIIYCGLTFISQANSLVLLINLWVLLNLMLGGQKMHQWYHQHFPNYPKERSAVLPFLF